MILPSATHPRCATCPTVVQENELFTRTHRAYYLQNRNNMFVTWNYRRACEGAENYKGGLVWHEGQVTFKRDATLAGPVPVPLFYLAPNNVEGTSTVVLVKDSQGGPDHLPADQGPDVYEEAASSPRWLS